MIYEGLSEKVAFELRLKNKKAQSCQEQKEEPWLQREQQVPRKALVYSESCGRISLTCWRKRKKE